MKKIDIQKARGHFPQLARTIRDKPLVYFDNAASTLKPKSVLDIMDGYYRNDTANIHRGIHYLSERGTDAYERARGRIARFIGAKDENEIIFTKGTTDSINLAATSFGERFLERGDHVLVTTMEHHSNMVPWQMASQKKGALIKEVPITDSGEIDLEAYEKLLGPKSKILTVCLVSNTLGTVNPVAKMAALAQDNGTKVFVDAAQAPAHVPLDVGGLACDFLAFSGHKMFGPTGTGILYGRRELLEAMPPYQGGGGMIDKVSFTGTLYGEVPHKFEAGTPDVAGILGLEGAVDYIENTPIEAIASRERELLAYAEEAMRATAGVKIIGEAPEKASVISFVLEGTHPHDLAVVLDRKGIAVRSGHHCTQPLMKRLGLTSTARLSLCFYNTKEEIDAFLEALEEGRKLLR